MRIIVCGGRDYSNKAKVFSVLTALDAMCDIKHLAAGCAAGADSFALAWARFNDVAYRRWDADWDTHGREAGPIRNNEMLCGANPDLVVAFPGGKGTKNMVRQAYRNGVSVLLVAAPESAWP